MSKFRFTAEMFTVEVHSPYVRIETAAKIANAVLEAAEAKCERVCELSTPSGTWVNGEPETAITTALLWNVEKINE